MRHIGVISFIVMATIVTLNVGGRIFETCLGTLLKYPDSLLSKMFDPDSHMKPSVKDKNGNWFIDRNPDLFSSVLDFYRSDIYPEQMTKVLKHEFKYWGIYKKECTSDQKFAKEFAQYIVSKFFRHYSHGGYGWVKNYDLSRFKSENNGDGGYRFAAPLAIFRGYMMNYIKFDDENAAIEDYPTPEKLKQFIYDNTTAITGALTGHYKHLVEYIVETSLAKKWQDEGIFSLGHKELRKCYESGDLTKDEIKIVWDNLKLFQRYVENFSIITCDLICEYLQKKLGNNRIKVSWTTIEPSKGVALEYDSQFVLPILDTVFPNHEDYHVKSFVLISKMLIIDINHDTKSGYGYDDNIYATLTEESYKGHDQNVQTKKRKKLY